MYLHESFFSRGTWGLAVLPSSSRRSCFLLVGCCNPIHAVDVCVCGHWWWASGVGGDRRTIPRWRLLWPVFAVPGGASSEARIVKVVKVLRFSLTSSAGLGQELLRLPPRSGERSLAARPEERGGRRAVRVGTARSSPKRTALCPLCRLQPRFDTRGAGVSRLTATSPQELEWVDIVASRAPPAPDTLVVMKSTRLKVLTELPEA